MKSIYFENDDILQIRVSDKPIVREVSQDWHTNISYAEDGTIVEIVLLDAKKEGLLPTRSPMTKKQLLKRDAKRDIGAELLLSVRQMTAGKDKVVTRVEVPSKKLTGK